MEKLTYLTPENSRKNFSFTPQSTEIMYISEHYLLSKGPTMSEMIEAGYSTRKAIDNLVLTGLFWLAYLSLFAYIELYRGGLSDLDLFTQFISIGSLLVFSFLPIDSLRRLLSRATILRIDALGVFDRRVVSEPIPWSQILSVNLVKNGHKHSVELELSDPERYLKKQWLLSLQKIFSRGSNSSFLALDLSELGLDPSELHEELDRRHKKSSHHTIPTERSGIETFEIGYSKNRALLYLLLCGGFPLSIVAYVIWTMGFSDAQMLVYTFLIVFGPFNIPPLIKLLHTGSVVTIDDRGLYDQRTLLVRIPWSEIRSFDLIRETYRGSTYDKAIAVDAIAPSRFMKDRARRKLVPNGDGTETIKMEVHSLKLVGLEILKELEARHEKYNSSTL